MQNNDLHIVEPTLRDQTGHCYALVMDMLANPSSKKASYQVWLSRRAGNLFGCQNQITEHKHFSRRFRRLESLLLYRKLIVEDKRFFISTATTTDMQLLHWAFILQRKFTSLNTNNIKLYIHWLYRSNSKLKRLSYIAMKYPNISLACPTKSVQDILKEAGFRKVELIPYPSAISQRKNAHLTTTAFNKLLFAGAARVDKGFPLVVKLIERLKEAKSQIPVTLQCSTTHKGLHDDVILSAIKRLQNIRYPFVNCLNETLERKDYQAMIQNSILIQPYNVEQFADRVSGVTLDAMKAGSPVIVPANTWMARLVDRFKAGVIVEEYDSVDQWLQAIDLVISDWQYYANNALEAGKVILTEHSPEKLINWLYES